MSVYKNGIWNNNYMNNYSFKTIIDPQVIQEPDGSWWVQVLHHKNPTTNKFASTDTFSLGVYKNANTWCQFNLFNICTKWELLVKQKKSTSDSEQKFRWIQNINPILATFADTSASSITRITTSGYTTSTFGGAYYNGGTNTYLVCNNGTSGNWFGAWGCWTAHGGGIPAYNGGAIVDEGYVDVYIRIDNDSLTSTDKAKIFQNQDIIANDFIEI